MEQAEYLSALVEGAESLASALLSFDDLPITAAQARDEEAVVEFDHLRAYCESSLKLFWDAVHRRLLALEQAGTDINPSQQEVQENHVCAVLERYNRMQHLVWVLRGGAAKHREHRTQIERLPVNEQSPAWKTLHAEWVSPSAEVATELRRERERLWDRARRHVHRQSPCPS